MSDTDAATKKDGGGGGVFANLASGAMSAAFSFTKGKGGSVILTMTVAVATAVFVSVAEWKGMGSTQMGRAVTSVELLNEMGNLAACVEVSGESFESCRSASVSRLRTYGWRTTAKAVSACGSPMCIFVELVEAHAPHGMLSPIRLMEVAASAGSGLESYLLAAPSKRRGAADRDSPPRLASSSRRGSGTRRTAIEDFDDDDAKEDDDAFAARRAPARRRGVSTRRNPNADEDDTF